MSVTLPEELANFIREKVSTGRFASSDEVVLEALRRMKIAERQEAEKLSWLQHAWRDGADAEDLGAIDFGVMKKEARARLVASKP